MAITFRGTKGSPLSHTELDQNFRELYYSSSLLGSPSNPYGLVLHKSSSLDSGETIHLPTAVGEQFNIQIKSGSDNISSSFFTSSTNFKYDFDNDHLSVSGSANYSGNVTVNGTLVANQYETVLVSSSISFKSGSTVSGNSDDDVHTFTGSVNINGVVSATSKVFANNFTGSSFTGSFNGDFKGTRLTGSLLSTNGVLSGSAQIATDISGSITSTSASIASTITSTSASLATTITTNSSSLASAINTNSSSIASLTEATSSYLLNTTDTLTGDLTVTGNITAQQFFTEIISSSTIFESGSTKFGDSADDTHEFTGSVNIQGPLGITGFSNVSASLATVIGSTGISNVVEDTSPQLGGNLDLKTSSISGSGSINIEGNIIVDGLISASGDIIAFASSDERLKDNITPIDGALDKVNQIGGYGFDWNDNSEHSGHDVGVIAQEIEKVLPELVVDRKDGYKAVRYDKIVALLINAIKEQQLQIDELKSKL